MTNSLISQNHWKSPKENTFSSSKSMTVQAPCMTNCTFSKILIFYAWERNIVHIPQNCPGRSRAKSRISQILADKQINVFEQNNGTKYKPLSHVLFPMFKVLLRKVHVHYQPEMLGNRQSAIHNTHMYRKIYLGKFSMDVSCKFSLGFMICSLCTERFTLRQNSSGLKSKGRCVFRKNYGKEQHLNVS